ncbi:MAG: prepilin-type N-terminal cleavage/methylation domain-containing protein [Planctomycetota bacterium]
MHRTPTPRRRGFSLIELLVVIGIIALLIGILLPVVARVRDSAKAAVCMSNMRQLALATTGYLNDNQYTFPQPHQETGGGYSDEDAGRSLWFNAIDYYLQQTAKDYDRNDTGERNYEQFKQDPVWLDLPEDEPGTTPDRRNMQTIKMNAFFGNSNISTPPSPNNDPVAWFKSTRVPQPGNTVIFVDGRAHDTPSTTSGFIDGTDFNANPTLVAFRHSGGANMTKVDGSVEHQINEIATTGAGYEGWYVENPTNDRELWPDVIFNFRYDIFYP